MLEIFDTLTCVVKNENIRGEGGWPEQTFICIETRMGNFLLSDGLISCRKKRGLSALSESVGLPNWETSFVGRKPTSCGMVFMNFERVSREFTTGFSTSSRARQLWSFHMA